MILQNLRLYIMIFFLAITFCIIKYHNQQNEIYVQAVEKKIYNHSADMFGISKIYQTQENGREWYINMTDPSEDKQFSISYDELSLKKQPDNSWRVGGSEVKLNVNSSGKELWRNVEITGYLKVVGFLSFNETIVTEDFDRDYDISWIARSGKHSNSIPCDGTALIGSININGFVSWKKEIWHTGGYTGDRAKQKIADSIFNRWVGWKTIVYNTENNSAVKMESYIDNKNSGYWIKVSEIIDNGGWNAKNSNQIFYTANCGKKIDHIITESKPYVTFRTDNVIWDFKNLSIREIDPNKMIYVPP